MKVISTNVGNPKTFIWQGTEEQTGIFKYPVEEPIYLGTTLVDKDTIIDRKHHGGSFKACYLFSASHYPYWKQRYPSLKWDWGMFGENVTIEGMDDSQLKIGSVYQLGQAVVQITVPREPCYKLGIRFNDQNIVAQFVEHGNPGSYVRILEQGAVTKGDPFVLVQDSTHPLTIADFYRLLYSKEKDPHLLQMALELDAIPSKTRDKLSAFIKKGA
jgi:MOSC domain-containing protein YiiM